MKEFDIAQIITRKRKEQHLTQEQLAAQMGVSKASVSKWETGQSYPDIILLPQLATFFNISVDELLGYSPQMTKAAIKRSYRELAAAFASQPFDKAVEQCHALIKEYYSCFPLLLQMVILYLNHSMLAPSDEARIILLEEAVGLCQRIRENCTDPGIVRQAGTMEASCYMMLQRPADVIDLLGDSASIYLGEDILLANAQLMSGDAAKATETLQVSLLQSLIGMMNAFPLWLSLSTGQPDKADEIIARMRVLIDTFKLEDLYANCAAVYLGFAQCYIAQGRTDEAYESIEDYVRLCGQTEYPVQLHGDEFFDCVGPWMDELELGTGAPRDEQVIKESMLQGLAANPFFASLAEEGRFKMLIKNLEEKLRA